MQNLVVVGLQWGDEGKGKIVDWLAEQADVVVRFQGGQNAGHTIKTDQHQFKLSQLPSGILRKGKVGMIGSGVVLDPFSLLEEISRVQAQGITISEKNLVIAENTSLLLPFHIELDLLREEQSGRTKIGTTGKGIGPAYEDRVGRRAIKIGDLTDPVALDTSFSRLVQYHNTIRRGMKAPLVDAEPILQRLKTIAPKIAKFAKPSWSILRHFQQEGKRLLFEGAQGTFLDIDHGTYPYVTSSSTVAGNAATGSGLGPNKLGYVLGICKAYQTRVGEGPFPTEINDEQGKKLASLGHEFGTVTGRLRRCGWIDTTMVKMACDYSGVNGIALMKLDVLDQFAEIKIGIGYTCDGEHLDYLPFQVNKQKRLKPIYKTLPGWQCSTVGIRNRKDLPPAALHYISVLENILECPIDLVSTSPLREDTILYSSTINQYLSENAK